MAKHTAPTTSEIVDETTEPTTEEPTADSTATDEVTEPAEVEETDESTDSEDTDTEEDKENTFLSPFKAAEYVNAILADSVLTDKKDSSKKRVLPAQMLYQYAGKAMLHNGLEGDARKGAFKDEAGKWQVSLAVLDAWTANYIKRQVALQEKKAAKVEAELKGEVEAETDSKSDEQVNELVEA